MPFEKVSTMDQRTRFIGDYLSHRYTHAGLCSAYGISRPTGYKWIARYEAEGPAGLIERSRRPHRCPQATDPEVVGAIVELRKRFRDWGVVS